MEICPYAKTSKEALKYHNKIWGVPKIKENELFKWLTLEMFQSGLSWQIVLKKIPYLIKDFSNFNYKKISKYTKNDIKRLMNDKKIIRNYRKIVTTIHNAKIIGNLHKNNSSLSKLTWTPVNYKPIIHRKHHNYALPTKHITNIFLPRFKKAGFKMIGKKTLYSYLQGVGVVNDHVIYCFRYPQVKKLDKKFFEKYRKKERLI